MKAEVKTIKIEDIIVPMQRTRAYQDSESEQALKSSIAKYGVLQPIIVRKVNDKYELVAGESRLQHALVNGLETIEAKVYEQLDDTDALLISLIENRARGSLDLNEFINALERLVQSGYSLKEISELLGLSYDHVRHLSRLTKAPTELKAAVSLGEVDIKTAEEILSMKDEEKIKQATQDIIEFGKDWSRENKIAYVKHAYKKQCDMCNRENVELTRTGTLWLCQQCYEKQYGKTETPQTQITEYTTPCLLCYEKIEAINTQLIKCCPVCEEKISMLARFSKEITGYEWREISAKQLAEALALGFECLKHRTQENKQS